MAQGVKSGKYFQRNSDFTALVQPFPPSRAFTIGIVIPCYQEYEELLNTLRYLQKAYLACSEKCSVIILLVVNQPHHAPEAACRQNQQLIHHLTTNDGSFDGLPKFGETLFLIDAENSDFKLKNEGVGAARKLGFDTLCRLYSVINDGEMTDRFFWSKLLLCSLDADTWVKDNYISAVQTFFAHRSTSCGAAVVPFQHQPACNRELQRAMDRYELYLLDYAAQLHNLPTPYWHWSIGSAMTMTGESYLRSGGMVNVAAGEDFYMLQQLHKVTRVGIIPETMGHPASRFSQRTPFGTGAMLQRLVATPNTGLYPAPILFAHQRAVLTQLKAELVRSPDAIFSAVAAPEWNEFAMQRNLPAAWQKILRNTPASPMALEAALDRLIDGFELLKYRHFLEARDPANFAPQSYSRRFDSMKETNLLRSYRELLFATNGF